MSRLPNTKKDLRADIRGLRSLVRDLDTLLNRPETDWDLIETIARDIEAGSSALACMARENLDHIEAA